MTKEKKRIAYNNWINSQLSVARHYGWINIEGEYFEFDREVMKQMANDPDDWRLYKPDLVLYK